mgnify:CR=1 FL=1
MDISLWDMSFDDAETTELNSFTPNLWRQVESFRVLMQVAASDGNYLQRSWYPVLKCISALDVVNVSGALKRGSMFSVWEGPPARSSVNSAHVACPKGKMFQRFTLPLISRILRRILGLGPWTRLRRARFHPWRGAAACPFPVQRMDYMLDLRSMMTRG